MAIVRCEKCGKPTRNVTRPYVASVQAVGYPKTAALCGRKGCENPGLVWLTSPENTKYLKGERVFRVPTYAIKVRVQ